MLRRAAGLLVCTALAVFAVSCGESSRAMPSPAAIATAKSISRAVSISAPESATPEAASTEEHVTLAGHVFGSGPEGVVLAHMRPADQTAWFPYAAVLAATGKYTVLTFDFRGFGESPGDKDFDAIDVDLQAAYDYLRGQGLKKIFLVGASMGGTASLVLATEEPVAGVATISALGQFPPLDAVAAVPSVTVPKLFITSEGDAPQARSQEEMFAEAADPKDQAVYDGNAHGTDLLQGPHAKEVEAKLTEFLGKW